MKYTIKWTGENPVVFYDQGKRIELKQNDIAKVNVIPTGINFELIGDEYFVEKEKENEYLEFEKLLKNSGLSPIRTSKVLNKFKSLKELKANKKNLPFEEVTNEFIKKNILGGK